MQHTYPQKPVTFCHIFIGAQNKLLSAKKSVMEVCHKLCTLFSKPISAKATRKKMRKGKGTLCHVLVCQKRLNSYPKESVTKCDTFQKVSVYTKASGLTRMRLDHPELFEKPLREALRALGYGVQTRGNQLVPGFIQKGICKER